jgi:hypothetical protein
MVRARGGGLLAALETSVVLGQRLLGWWLGLVAWRA